MTDPMLHKFLKMFNLNENDEDSYLDDENDYLDDENDFEEKPQKITKANDEVANKPKLAAKVLSSKSYKRTATVAGMEVCVIKPTSFEDSKEITETLLANRTVVLNLEGLNMDVAQRIFDFSSGSCYAIGGNLQKISQAIFIITPPTVDILSDSQNILSGSLDDASSINNSY